MAKYYDNKVERISLIKEQNRQGLSLIHDNFINKQGNRTDGKSGQLIFGTPKEEPERIIKTKEELNQLLFDKRITYLELLDLLVIQGLSSTRWEKFKAMFGVS